MTPDTTPAMYGCIVIALVAIAQLLLIAHLLDKVDKLLKAMGEPVPPRKESEP